MTVMFSKLFTILSCTELIDLILSKCFFTSVKPLVFLKMLFLKKPVKFTLTKCGCCSYNNNNGWMWVEGQV